ncbi:microfibril-associated glycoprotein 4-like isoform X1 [Drosophila innubila]|uniref:microfibril-associated glycoprotein 4-like isoform X1 n=1 Tax=Drosophila innubila TaxID=198719 RepID=UPI00148E2C7C|nr:microfibril-associated glycoprotein 4-like isoform X1 [Drosophila innubila]
MLQNIICIFLMLSAFTFLSDATTLPPSNETNVRAGQGKMINDLAKDSESQLIRADIQFIKAMMEQQTKDINVVVSDNQCRAETEKQKKDIIDREKEIRSLKADILTLRTELQQKNKDLIDKETNILTLNAELENQRKSVLAKESNIQLLKNENQLLRTEEERNRKLLQPHNCTEAKSSGINEILLPKFSSQPFKVACDAETQGGGWTIILRRIDGSVNFHRNWTEYNNGFGDLNGEFFIGLDKIHEMTAERNQELLVLLEDFEGNKTFEKYDEFAIGNEDQQYELHTLGKASGTAGNSLLYHHGSKFSTFDRDIDGESDIHCAEQSTGGWWYRSNYYCQSCKLTGTYGNNDYDKGVNWDTFRGSEYSLKKAVMMIRPRK